MRGDKSTYEYSRIRLLAASLAEAGICGETAARILEEGDKIRRSATPESKAEWMAEAMRRMDTLLDEPTRRAVRERCACCLGGKRLQMARSIARDHESLEERIRAANDARLLFGDNVSLTENGEVLVRYWPEGQPRYRCDSCRRRKNPSRSPTATAAAAMSSTTCRSPSAASWM
jgi:hypothetical protein